MVTSESPNSALSAGRTVLTTWPNQRGARGIYMGCTWIHMVSVSQPLPQIRRSMT